MMIAFTGGSYTGCYPNFTITVSYGHFADAPAPTEHEDLAHNPHYQAAQLREFLAAILRQVAKALPINFLDRSSIQVSLPRRAPPAIREWKFKLWKQAL